MADTPPRHYSATYRFLAAVCKTFVRLLGTPRWRGTEHLPREGGYIAAANHIGNVDPITTAHVLYNNGAPPRIMAKAELWKVPVLSAILRHTGQIPVVRGTRTAADSLDAAEQALTAGECVLIFPEGTHTKDPDEWPMVARTGVARLALRTGVPVVPIAQWGANLVVPNGKPWFRPFPRPHFDAIVGAPVDLSDLVPADGAAPSSEVLTEATARVMAAITAQLAEIRGEAPPERPWVRGKGRA